MKLAIHKNNRSDMFFSSRWFKYCIENNISFKAVDCYKSDIISQLSDCDALLWHFSHADPIAYQIAVKLIASLEAAGKCCFPNLNACWHFDDKVAQKYLLEAIHAPLIPSVVFFNKHDALQWARQATFPKVFKLKGGAGSANVQLVSCKRQAVALIQRAFSTGFRQFDRNTLFRYSIKQTLSGNNSIVNAGKDFLKIFVKSEYEKVRGQERGYVYFQEFIPNNTFDIRVVIIGHRAVAIKRMVRPNDFRASGSGHILYDRHLIDERCVEIAFTVATLLKTNCLTFDFLFDDSNSPLIAEISYGFVQEGYDACKGYWDSSMVWHEAPFSLQHWMIDDIIQCIKTMH